ncbi:hypothetical protein KAR91_29680 [Candidatus Pacearchaeota archaeon]|nr:hypothetical protein [Candidatus Pacearchaeota archaeon]
MEIEKLPDEIGKLKEIIADLYDDYQQKDALHESRVAILEERIAILQARLFGPKSEKRKAQSRI